MIARKTAAIPPPKIRNNDRLRARGSIKDVTTSMPIKVPARNPRKN
jgi:hypothetical protein